MNEMIILKKWKGLPEKLQAEGEPVDWFETTEAECLEHTEQADYWRGYWREGSVLQMLAEGGEVWTPTARYKAI